MNCDCDCCPEIELTTQISPERITILLQRQPDAHRDESKVAANMKARQIYEKRRNARGTLRFPGSDFFSFPCWNFGQKKKNAAQNEKKNRRARHTTEKAKNSAEIFPTLFEYIKI